MLFVRRLLVLLSLGTLLPAALAHAQLPERLAGELTEIQRAHNIPVLALALQIDGRVVSKVMGGTPATPLRWGSITKTITALTVLELAARDQVDLQAPLSNYVPVEHWANPWRASHPVRVIDLLELRAGFTDLSAAEFNFNEPVDLETALALNPAHRVTRWPPGIQHGYSNLAPGLTQLLIERVTGKPYASVARELVFEPVGMADAGFAPDTRLPGGFEDDGTTPIPYWHMTFPAYGALNAPLNDMIRLLDALQSLPAAKAARLYRPGGRQLAPDFTFDYAAGLYPRVRQGRIWHTHGGDADGYRSRLATLRPEQRAYIVNINVDNPAVLRRIERLLEAALTRDMPAVPPPATVEVNLDGLAGTYYPSSARFGIDAWQSGSRPTATVAARGSMLTFTRNGRTTTLWPVAPGQFRRDDDPAATVVFVRDEDVLYLQGELGNYARVDACPDFMRAIPQCDQR